MKKAFLFLTIVSFCFTATAQVKFELKPEAGVGAVFYNFTADSLIPPNRTNSFSAGSMSFINLRINFQTADYKWLFSTGTGITTNKTIVRKNNGFDRFFDQLLLFYGSGGDLPIKNIIIKYQNINLPVGVAYNLNKKNPAKFQSYFGVDAVLQFNVAKQIKIHAPSYNYTNVEIEQISKEYKKRVEPFMLMLMPKFEFRTDVKKNIRHAFILSPFAFYSQPQLNGLTVKPFSMQMAYAVCFQLN
jgi:hypothetical protein